MTTMAIKLLMAKYERSEPTSTCRLVVPGALVALTIKRAQEAKHG